MLEKAHINEVVVAALREDAPWGDASAAVMPKEARVTAQLVARAPGVLSGLSVFASAFELVDSNIRVEAYLNDADALERGVTVAEVSGPAISVLRAERVALNFVQRMSGIATLTRRYVEAISGTRAHIVDTRKTTPGLRAFERQAVLDGGGHNHRFSLSDAVMLKDNHLAVLKSHGGDLAEVLLDAQSRTPHTMGFEVEVDRLDQIPALLEAGVPIIMLDNFSINDLRAGVEMIAGQAIVEASGGVSLDTVRDIAETGVDLISVGALTHSAAALDLGLDISSDAA